MRGLTRPDALEEVQAAATLDSFDQSLTSVTTTAKWIVSASAAVLAVLVAGLQLSQVGGLELDRLLVALSAYLVAVACCGVILFSAARVLITAGFTASDLADREMLARLKAVEAAKGIPADVRPASEFDPLLAAIARRRGELLPGQPLLQQDLQSFYRHHGDLVAAWATIRSGLATALDGRTYQPTDPSDVATLQGQVDESYKAAAKLVDAAHLYVAKHRYRQLLRTLKVAGTAVVIAVPVFAVASHVDLVEASVRAPTATNVLLEGTAEDLREAGVPKRCRSKALTGVAVGGTYAQPLVVITAPEACRGARLLVTAEVGVALPAIPAVDSAGTP